MKMDDSPILEIICDEEEEDIKGKGISWQDKT